MRRLSLVLLAAACAHAPGEKGVVTLAPAQVATAFTPRRFALLIGVPGGTDDRWRPLRFAEKDVDDFARLLRDPLSGGYEAVLTRLGPAQTSRSAILAAVSELERRATRPEDIVLLYVSAHGTLARDVQGRLVRYLVTSDADFSRPADSALSVVDLQAAFDRVPSRRRVLVLATCHSGAGKSLLSEEVARELASLKGPARTLEEVSRASLVLSASDFGEAAREDEGLQNDVYTHFLLEGLAGPADRNGDGAVTATEAHDWARRKTWAFSSGRQRPSAELLEVGADPLVLTGQVARVGRPEVFSYAARLDGLALVVDGEPRLELPGGLALPPGRHVVELTKGAQTLAREELQLTVGQRVELETLLDRREPSLAVSVHAGGFAFVDQKSRDEVLPGGATLGAAVRFDRLFGTRLALALDASGFGGQAALSLGGPSATPVSWVALQGGLSLGVSARLGPVVAFLGPRVAGLWVERSFSLTGFQGRQAALSVMPGLWAGAALQLGRFEVGLHLQPMLTLLTIDGALRALGYVSGWASAGVRL